MKNFKLVNFETFWDFVSFLYLFFNNFPLLNQQIICFLLLKELNYVKQKFYTLYKFGVMHNPSYRLEVEKILLWIIYYINK